MLADIAAEAERLHEIIENLLSLTRLGTGTQPELEPTALDRVIQRSVGQVRRRYPDHPIAFSSRPSVIVEADRTYLELLIENLVGNAAKYSPDGSPIDVLVEEADDEVRVLVLDRGIGLDEQPGADLFEPFYRGERPVPRPAAWASASRSAAGSCTCSAGASGHERATTAGRSSASRCQSRRTSTTRPCGPL